jgi:class 3 adenylate cyclase
MLAARHLQRLGHHRAATPYFVEARQALNTWGAAAIAAQLDPALAEASTPHAATPSSSHHTLDGVRLEAVSALRAARAISSEIHLDALVRSLVLTVAQATGANGALLAIHDAGRFGVVARLEQDGASVWSPAVPAPLDPEHPLAEAVIRHSAATRTVIRMDDARRDDRFARHASTPTSVLCVPLTKGAELVGSIYLENRLATSAFGEDHAELVELLAGQAAVSIENARLYEDLRRSYDDQKQLADSFARFVPPQFLDLLGKRSVLDVQRGDAISGDFSMLFADVRDFTARAERLGPEATFAFVNRYLYHVEPAIHRHAGFVHQLLGDGIVAVFRSPEEAVRGALAMLAATEALNAQLSAEGAPPMRVGIGVSSGRLMMGAIGGSTRLDRGAVGDVVNVASRVEGMTKRYGATLLISGATRDGLPAGFQLRRLDRVIAVGKTEPMEVFEVLDALPTELIGLRCRQRPAWDEAVDAWLAGRMAAPAFEQVLALGPDPAASLFLERIRRGETPGVHRLREK